MFRRSISLSSCCALLCLVVQAHAFETLVLEIPETNLFAFRDADGGIEVRWDSAQKDVERMTAVSINGLFDRLAKGTGIVLYDLDDGWNQVEVAEVTEDGVAGARAFTEFYVADRPADLAPENNGGTPPAPFRIVKPENNTTFKFMGKQSKFMAHLEIEFDVNMVNLWQGSRTASFLLDGKHYGTAQLEKVRFMIPGQNQGHHTISGKMLPVQKKGSMTVGEEVVLHFDVSKDLVHDAPVADSPVWPLLADAKSLLEKGQTKDGRERLFKALAADPNCTEARNLLLETGHRCKSGVDAPWLLLDGFGFQLQYRTESYATHQPLLHTLVTQTTGPILEVGMGLHSTHMLHALCAATNRTLISIDQYDEWVDKFRWLESDSPRHTLLHADTLDDPKLNFLFEKSWNFSVVLVDQSDWGERLKTARMFINDAEYVVMHDGDYFMFHDVMNYKEFKYYKEFLLPHPWPDATGPPALALSERHDVSKLFVDYNCYEDDWIVPNSRSQVGDKTTFVHRSPAAVGEKKCERVDTGIAETETADYLRERSISEKMIPKEDL